MSIRKILGHLGKFSFIIIPILSSCGAFSLKQRHVDTWVVDPNVKGWNIEVDCAGENCGMVSDKFTDGDLRFEIRLAGYVGKRDYRDYSCFNVRFTHFPEGMKYNPTKTIIKDEDGEELEWELRPCSTPQSLAQNTSILHKPDESGDYVFKKGKNYFFYYYHPELRVFNLFKIKFDGLTQDGKPYYVPELTIVRDRKTQIRPTQ